MSLEPEQNLSISERNLTIAQDLLDRSVEALEMPAFEWVVVVCFYSSVRGINAYLGSLGIWPRTHAQRSRAIRETSPLWPVLDSYLALENWSRDARYTSHPAAFDRAFALTALDSARRIDAHIALHLSAE